MTMASFNKTTEVRAAIESLVGRDYISLNNDKRKFGRRLKFLGMDLTNAQLDKVNGLIRKFNAVAEHADVYAMEAGKKVMISSLVVNIKV